MTDAATNEDRSEALSLDDLQYVLPQRLIAQHPPAGREDARLLVLDPATGELFDRSIPDWPELLRPGDLLVLNDTKVLPARFAAHRKTGAAVTGLFLEELALGRWLVMLAPSRRLKIGETLDARVFSGPAVEIMLEDSLGEGRWEARVSPVAPAQTLLDRIGVTPLPPYIHREDAARGEDQADRLRYQTIYARHAGAVAAPTAGLHLTEALLERVRSRGVDVAFVTLHVGPGTFKPIAAANLADHVMHFERYNMSGQASDAVNTCKARGGRVIAVGTTSVRVLESCADAATASPVSPGSGTTNLFIYPPYKMRVVDALLTNFHLPGSTLLALVMALTSKKLVTRAYRHAVAQEYRFYSYGDAMFIQ